MAAAERPDRAQRLARGCQAQHEASWPVVDANRRADAERIEELRRFVQGERFDEEPPAGLDSEALDFRAASESFAPALRSPARS